MRKQTEGVGKASPDWLIKRAVTPACPGSEFCPTNQQQAAFVQVRQSLSPGRNYLSRKSAGQVVVHSHGTHEADCP